MAPIPAFGKSAPLRSHSADFEGCTRAYLQATGGWNWHLCQFFLGCHVGATPEAWSGVRQEGKIGSTWMELDAWIKTFSQPRMMVLEATFFTRWIYDLLSHAEKVRAAHPLCCGPPPRPRGITAGSIPARSPTAYATPSCRVPHGVGREDLSRRDDAYAYFQAEELGMQFFAVRFSKQA